MVSISRDETVAEATIVEELLKFSEFEDFDRNRWKPRKKDILIDWKINSSCDGFSFQGFDEISGKPFIRLRKIPKTRDDAFLVAHEIEHIIRHFDKQYLEFAKSSVITKYKDEEIVDLSIRLGSFFDDPIVNSFLHDVYHFNPIHFYTKVKMPETVKSLNSSGDLVDDLTRLKRALFYSQCALEWDSIEDKVTLRKWRELKRLYQMKRPIVKRMGEELYSMAKEDGYDTLEKQTALFDKIANKYTIDGIKISSILRVNHVL